MSKTIIITTDEMRNLLIKYFNDISAITDVFCENCQKEHHGACIAPTEDLKCPHDDENEIIDTFINIVFANYMIPFS